MFVYAQHRPQRVTEVYLVARHANVTQEVKAALTRPGSHIRMFVYAQRDEAVRRLGQTGGAGVVMPASASAATTSSRLIPSR